MPLKANDYHNHLKLKTKAQICYFLLFLSVFLPKIALTSVHFSTKTAHNIVQFHKKTYLCR